MSDLREPFDSSMSSDILPKTCQILQLPYHNLTASLRHGRRRRSGGRRGARRGAPRRARRASARASSRGRAGLPARYGRRTCKHYRVFLVCDCRTLHKTKEYDMLHRSACVHCKMRPLQEERVRHTSPKRNYYEIFPGVQ